MSHCRTGILFFFVWIIFVLGFPTLTLRADDNDSIKKGWSQTQTPFGICVTLEIDKAALRRELLEDLKHRIRHRLRLNRLRYRARHVSGGKLMFAMPSDTELERVSKALEQVRLPVPGGRGYDLDIKREGRRLMLSPTQAALDDLVEAGMVAAIETLKNRIESLGHSDYSITRPVRTRLDVRVPGLASFRILYGIMDGRSQFSIRLLALLHVLDDPQKRSAPPGYVVLQSWNDPARTFLVPRRMIVTGHALVEARAVRMWSGTPAIRLKFQSVAADRLRRSTARAVGRRLAFVVDGKVIGVSKIRSEIAGGILDFVPDATPDQVEELAALIRATFFPAPMRIIKEETCL